MRRVDLIIRGGTVLTMDGSRRVLDKGAIAVLDDRIVAVGQADEIAREYQAERNFPQLAQ